MSIKHTILKLLTWITICTMIVCRFKYKQIFQHDMNISKDIFPRFYNYSAAIMTKLWNFPSGNSVTYSVSQRPYSVSHPNDTASRGLPKVTVVAATSTMGFWDMGSPTNGYTHINLLFRSLRFEAIAACCPIAYGPRTNNGACDNE